MESRNPLPNRLSEQAAWLKERLGDNADFIIRSFDVGALPAFCAYLSTIVDKASLEEFIEQAQRGFLAEGTGQTGAASAFVNRISASPSAKPLHGEDETVSEILNGNAAFFFEGENVGVALSTAKFPKRNPEQPGIETSTRGAQIGFVEEADDNIALIRSRLRTSSLVVRQYEIGERTRTFVAVCYLKDVANPEAVRTLDRRLKAIRIDSVSQSSAIEARIADNRFTPFPLLRPTQRIDNTAKEINQGKFAIIVNGDPTVLLGPAALQDFYQTAEDYSHSFLEATFIRWLRVVAFFLALFLPALYVAFTEFNPELLPLTLGLRIASSRVSVPFPAVIEVVCMELVIEILREATLRMPKQMGQSIGIVGGLVIGQATVAAGLASNVLIVLVALTTIATFVPPSYEIATAWRMVKYVFFAAASCFGMLGLFVAFLMVLYHLASLKSFGIVYLSPIATGRFKDWGDLFVRIPVHLLRRRTAHLSPTDATGEIPYEDPRPHPRLSKEKER